ncbi:MAG: transposase [Bacteroidota bacterium]
MSSKKLNETQSQNQTKRLDQKHNRIFSETFRKSKVKEILEKRITVKQVCELYGVSRTSVYKWLYKYSNLEKGTKQVVEMQSESSKTRQALERVAELERIVGQKQLTIDLLEETLIVASEELGYDVKKKYAPKSSKDKSKTI